MMLLSGLESTATVKRGVDGWLGNFCVGCVSVEKGAN